MVRSVSCTLLGAGLLLLNAAGQAGARSADSPTASALLAAVAESYAAADVYRDRGEIEISRGDDAPRRLTFETLAGAAGMRFVLHEADRTQAIWSIGSDSWVYDSGDRKVRSAPSAAGEIGTVLGAAGLDLLAVPALLAGSRAPITGYLAAAVEGPVECAEGSEVAGGEECWRLELAHPGGVGVRLSIERLSHRILRVEVETGGPAAGSPPGGGRGAATRLVATHFPVDSGTPPGVEELVFQPRPADEQGVAAAESAAETVAFGEVFGETVEVRLRTFIARAVDQTGEALRDLRPADFAVHAGRGRRRTEVPLVAVDWIGPDRESVAPRRPDRPAFLSPVFGRDGAPPEPVAEQQVVLFVQSDPYPSRMRGQLKELPAAREMLSALPAGDRIAVVSFDSHLKLWQDLTHDRQAVFEALERAVRFGGRPAGRRTAGEGLAASWDSRRAQRVSGPEAALAMTAEALLDLPGEKVVIYLGWGLGRFDRGGVRLGPEYARAVSLLSRARASVFVLDISDSAYHTLELGLRAVAEQTGGSYAKTHTFGRRESLRLASTVSGYYRVTVDASALAAEPDEWTLELRNRQGKLLWRSER